MGILFFFSISMTAQEATSVIEKVDNIGDETGTVLSTKINRASEKTILKEWKGKMKDWDGDVDIKKSMITSKEVKIEAIDENGLEIIAEVRRSTDQEFEFIAMFIKNGKPVSSDSDISGFAAAKNIVRNFANEVSKEATEVYQKAQLKLFEELEDELENAKKEREKAEEDIKEAEEEIKKANEIIKQKKKDLSDNKSSQEHLAKKIAEQEKKVKNANEEMGLFK